MASRMRMLYWKKIAHTDVLWSGQKGEIRSHWVNDLEAFLSYDMIRGDVGIAGNTILVSGAKGGPGP